MKYINRYCADVGTVNCPCPLAETGDCLICGRLSGKGMCDCHWAGLCIYNEYIQNDSVVRNPRQDRRVRIVGKTRYSADLLVLELEVSRDMALNAAKPGAFVFLKAEGSERYADTPVSVMMSDVEKGRLHVALKVISGKTKRIADAEGFLVLRGIYRNGLLGEGLEGLHGDLSRQGALRADAAKGRKKWLIMTRGAGFAPAVNLLRWADGRVDTHMIIDTEKISEELVNDYLQEYASGCPEGAASRLEIRMAPLQDIAEDGLWERTVRGYDRVFILASDYYIGAVSEKLAIPDGKLIFSNNFHMCCGEGICGACGHTDAQGCFSKMCKCRHFHAEELRG